MPFFLFAIFLVLYISVPVYLSTNSAPVLYTSTFYTHVFNTYQRIKPLYQKIVLDTQTTLCRV